MPTKIGATRLADGRITADQAARLRVLGCEYGQGYHFFRPLVREALVALLAKAAQPRPALDAVAD